MNADATWSWSRRHFLGALAPLAAGLRVPAFAGVRTAEVGLSEQRIAATIAGVVVAPRVEAIRAATLDGARFLRLDRDLGSASNA